MDNEKTTETIKAAKDIIDASGDIQKIDEILADSQKFRQKSNQVYHEIVSKTDYAPYIAVARTANNHVPFEKITEYAMRRKIMGVLRKAVIAYTADTAKKATEDK